MNIRTLRATLVLCAVVLAASMALSDCYVTVLHFNDFHGHLQSKVKDGKAEGGIARMATMVEQVREYNDAHGVTTLFFEAGDILQGTPLSTVYKGEPDIKCLNLMKLDAMCIGNHEFDFGQDVFQRMVALADFPILSANIYCTDTGRRYTDAIMYFTLADGTSGAAFGLTTADTAVQTSPKNVVGLKFTDPIEEARKVMAELHGKADFIIAITHLGYDEDIKLGEAVDGIDLIIGGHSHTEVQPPTEAGDTLVCQAGGYGLFLGQVDMLVSNGDIVKYRGFLRPVNEQYHPRADVQAIVDQYADALQERLAEVIATTTVDLDGVRENIRARETNLGNLICDLIRDYANADVCLWNGGGIRESISAGPITVGDILTVLPFGNIVANKQVTGAELRRVLEFNAAQPRPFGGFTQVSGLTMEIIGDKLGAVTVGGEPLDDNNTYTLAASEFMLAGGDGYSMLTEGSEPVYLGYSESAIVLEALRELGTVSPAVEGRITIR